METVYEPRMSLDITTISTGSDKQTFVTVSLCKLVPSSCSLRQVDVAINLRTHLRLAVLNR